MVFRFYRKEVKERVKRLKGSKYDWYDDVTTQAIRKNFKDWEDSQVKDIKLEETKGHARSLTYENVKKVIILVYLT